MRRKITLVSVDAGSGHACGLAQGLANYGKVTIVWERKNLHQLDYLTPKARYGFQFVPSRGDHLIIVGCITFDRMETKFKRRFWGILSNYAHVHIIVTDGKFARNPDYYNKRFKHYDIITTACKRHFREPLPVKTYYQPFDLSHINQTKNDILTVAHSPFVKKKFREKGTNKIIRVVKKTGADFDLIAGISWDACLRRKAKAHIFVDQIDHYDRDKFKFKSPDYVWPALGKSGIEAMHLGCLTITHGKSYVTEIPPPPVAWCVKDSFKEVLDYYISHPTERNELAEKQKEWALKYASYDYAARNVLGLD